MEAVNQFQKQHLHRLISQHFGGGAVPRLLEALWADGATVAAYDPNALADGRLRLAATKEEATEGADALVICTERKRFMARNFEQLAKSLRQQLIKVAHHCLDGAFWPRGT